jgi:TIR domain/WD domain, G-beta repeat
MADDFQYDVFLSYSVKDKAVVLPLAQRLRQDGLRVWLDDWQIRPGDSVPAKMEDGLERSRVLVLCMSANAFGADWPRLESYTFRFRDPLNKERRFIPLRLDDAPAKGSLGQFLYISWLPEDRESAYAKLLEACRPPAKLPTVEAQTARKLIISYGFSPDGKCALSGAKDGIVRLWDMETSICSRVLEGHTDSVWSVAWSADQRRALSSGNDKTVRLWDVETGRCLHVLEGHALQVLSAVLTADQRRALSGSTDHTMRLWDVETGVCLRVFEEATGFLSVALSADQRRALSGDDTTVRLWDVETGICLRVLKGHTGAVWSVAWSADQRHALSGSFDNTVRLWDVETGRCLRVLEGHTDDVWSVAWSADQRHALSGAKDHAVRLWDLEAGRWTLLAHPHRPRPASPEPGPAAGPAFPWVFAFWVCGGLPGRNGPGAQTGNDG